MSLLPERSVWVKDASAPLSMTKTPESPTIYRGDAHEQHPQLFEKLRRPLRR